MPDSNKAKFEAALRHVVKVSKEELAAEERKPLPARKPGRKPKEV